MKKRRLFLLLLVVLMVMVFTACTGKGTVDDSVNVTPDTVGVESKTEQYTSDKVAVTDIEEKDIAKTTDAQEVKGDKQEKKANSSEINNDSTKKPESSDSQVQPGPVKDNGNNVTLWVTRDFGKSSILNKAVDLKKDWVVYDVLEASAQITTSHGGSFIDSINGLESKSGGFSGKQQDWFYYVNGVFADVGALDYYPQSGEVIWWDYHTWERMVTFPAVIGCYPEPFVHGYRGKVGPTTIMSSSDNRSLADNLQEALKAKGVASVNIKNTDANLLKNRQGPTIVLGEWSELSQIEWLAKLNKAYTKNGTCIHFTSDGLELLDYKGQVARTINQGAGTIVTTGEGSGDDSPLWLVVGTDPEGLQQAVDVLVKSPGKISRLYNAVVIAGEVTGLPVQ